MVEADVKSNITRKDLIADEVIDCVWKLVSAGVEKQVVSVRRLVMKSQSDDLDAVA